MPEPDLETEPVGRVDAQRNRQRLFHAARDAIAINGLDVSSLDIATAAGVGVGTLYRRFGTKEALLDAVVLGLYDDLCEKAEDFLESDDPWEGLSEFMMELAGAHRDSRGLAQVTAACDSNSPPSPEVTQRTMALQNAVTRLTERAHAAGALRSDVTWQDIIISSRASLDIEHCLGVDAGPDGWRRVITILLDGMRAPGTSQLHGPGPQSRAAYETISEEAP
ncbi:TetR/AcrR family transcriptional regulator [Herbiconiux sp. CPCC 205763]|uniref:TetR/AcrR family transcriptional regulator n=1 Tax=Herbiconiux aconitum TaxID=2970913 RepID=A0ABT2GVV0_9MICO|nr:TetR/AcrR family transcriptional regulator [Herbiconiux aconitum]MCS5720337.1 TetR/AcrR family transcriptional regulator [Herbiconiux aconitum]